MLQNWQKEVLRAISDSKGVHITPRSYEKKRVYEESRAAARQLAVKNEVTEENGLRKEIFYLPNGRSWAFFSPLSH